MRLPLLARFAVKIQEVDECEFPQDSGPQTRRSRSRSTKMTKVLGETTDDE